MTGATQHSVTARIVIGMDFKNFFDNVDPNMAASNLIKAGVPAATVDYIIKVCTFLGKLCQGAPTSPYLTNIALRGFDAAMSLYCKRRGFMYTRYADDITLSEVPMLLSSYSSGCVYQRTGPRSDLFRVLTGYVYHLIRGVEKLIKLTLPTLSLNPKKTRVSSPRSMCARLITGVVVRNDYLGYNAKRKYRDRVRAMCHNLYKLLVLAPEKAANRRQEWSQLKGSVLFMNTVRSYSASRIGSSPDPRIPDKLWSYLSNLFNAAKHVPVKRKTKGRKRGKKKVK